MPSAKSKPTNRSSDTIPASIQKAITGIAKGIGVAATELWVIFIRQYIVRGISEGFTALVLYVAAFLLKDSIGFYALIPFAVGMAFTYGAIAYLGNPKYYALADITKRIQDFKEESNKVEIVKSSPRNWS